MEDRKKGLIQIIEWYRDKWHKKDFCHSEMIDKIKNINDDKELEIYEQIIDGWIDE